MSTLTSTSTLAQVTAAYDDNASYAEDDSVSKCKAFITACRIILRRVPKRASHGGRTAGEEIEFDPTMVQAELERALAWLIGADDASGSGGGGIVHCDLRGFRD